MTHSFLTERGTRRIAKIGIGEAEFKYAGAEVIRTHFSPINNVVYLRTDDGKVVTVSDYSERNIRAFLRGIGA